MMTASVEVRRIARDYLPFVIFAPLLGVFAFAYDGVYIGATWARDMRNLMVLSLLIFLAAWLALRSFGNAGLWGALLVHYAARGGLEALRYPALLQARSVRVARTGQSSAVMVAASAPTIFDSKFAPGSQQRRGEIALDVVDEAKALVDQRRIKLDQAGAGADFVSAAPPLSMPPTPTSGNAPSART